VKTLSLIALALAIPVTAWSATQDLRRSTSHDGPRSEARLSTPLPSLLQSASDKVIEPDGTLSWKFLTRISVVRHENTNGRFGSGVAYFAEPVAAPEIKAMVGKRVKVKGYALPRGDSAPGGGRLLVSALPAIDPDGCTAGGTETFVDVTLGEGVMPKVDTLVTVEGTLELFDMKSWGGYIYKLATPRIIGGL
jgi:hypothetical protein